MINRKEHLKQINNKALMKVGDFITVVYYIPDTYEFGPLFDCYYGKITKFDKNRFIDFQIWGSIIDGKLKIGKTGDYKMADIDMVYQVGGAFGLSYLEDYLTFAKQSRLKL